TYIRSCGLNAPSGRRKRLNIPIGGPLIGSPSERASTPSVWHRRESSPRAARSVRRAARTLAERPLRRSPGPSPRLAIGNARATNRVRSTAGPFARVVVLGRHGRDESVEARLARKL